MGSNSSSYPDGRLLSIKGQCQQNVRDAKQYIQQKFIDSRVQAKDVNLEKKPQKLFGSQIQISLWYLQ